MKETDTKVAVIILNWNGEKLLREYLPEVIANTDPALATVIVADNGSTDGSRRLLAEEFPQVQTLLFDQNYGFAEGYNRALEATRYPYTVLLNSDVAPAPGWVAPLLDHMERNPRCGACQPKILSRREPSKFEYAGASGGFIDHYGFPYCRGRIFDECETDNGQYDDTIEVFWATGAALMTRTDLYLEVGGLDPRFFAHMEEIDLCWRIRLKGFSVAAVPASKVFHLGGGSLPASNPRKTYLNFRNNLLMLHKNLPADVRGSRLFVRRLLDTVAGAKFLLTCQFANAWAVVRAHFDFIKMRRHYPVPTIYDMRPDLTRDTPKIITNFYLHKRRRFSEIKK